MFISDIAKEHEINRLVVSNNELALLIIDVLDKLDNISKNYISYLKAQT